MLTGALPLQVVKVKVLECEPEKERLLLSFKAVVEGDTAGEGTAAPRVLMEVGQVTPPPRYDRPRPLVGLMVLCVHRFGPAM